MKHALLAATALVGMSVAAHAQIPVEDIPDELNTALTAVRTADQVLNSGKQLVQEVNMANAMIHGNAYSITESVPGLNGLVNPFTLNSSNFASFLGGGGSGGNLTSLAQQYLKQTQFYAPQAGDYRASVINSSAASAAAQLGAASSLYDSANQRAQLYPQLGTAIGATADVKAAVDANSRLTYENLVGQGQATKALTLISMQMAQERVRQAQEEQAERCSADTLVQDALAAAQAAYGGTVQLVTTPPSGVCNAQTSSSTASGAISGGASDLPDAGGSTSLASTDGSSAGLSGDPSVMSDAGGTGGTGGNDISGVGSSVTVSGSAGDPMSVMTSQSWGSQVASDAQQMGVNSQAVASVCVVENNCAATSNVTSGTQSITGAFQESSGAYSQYSAQAAAQNPQLASQLVGQNDSTSQGIAAAQYLKNNAINLQQNAGISNPTMLQAYGGYQWGPANGQAIAQASDDELLSQAMPNVSQTTLQNNNAVGETVGQWKASIVSKIGSSAANAPVLTTAGA